jgi:hypothetical protein
LIYRLSLFILLLIATTFATTYCFIRDV